MRNPQNLREHSIFFVYFCLMFHWIKFLNGNHISIKLQVDGISVPNGLSQHVEECGCWLFLLFLIDVN